MLDVVLAAKQSTKHSVLHARVHDVIPRVMHASSSERSTALHTNVTDTNRREIEGAEADPESLDIDEERGPPPQGPE